MKILVTGAAGFIGFFVSKYLLERGDNVAGIDNLNDYYDITLKHARLAQLDRYKSFSFQEIDIVNKVKIDNLFDTVKPARVIHLAAQAGVRYSLENPNAYSKSNVMGFTNILEACRHADIEHLVYASSSSVYGANKKLPFSIDDRVDQPISIYGATKKANELMAYAYSHLYRLPTTGLRFFTVYGPWGRPDMSYFKFTRNIIKGLPIDIYNNGQHSRDFTYIDDIVDGVIKAFDQIPSDYQAGKHTKDKSGEESLPYRLYNLGNNKPVDLMYYIQLLEELIGKKAIKNMLPLQKGDIPETYADIDKTIAELGYSPCTTIEQGLKVFVDWYKNYYGSV